MPYLLILLVGVPVLEIYLFILIGGEIGVLRTIVIIILTALLGGYLLRREGLSILRELGDKSYNGESVSETLVEGLLVLLAGALLLTPGFFTDAVGFLMILPWTRRWLGRTITRWFIGKFANQFGGFFYNARSASGDGGEANGDAKKPHAKTPPRNITDNVIDVEYEDVTSKESGDKDER